MTKLYTKNLSYKSILKDINIEFIENSINYISGSNKCGKTTLIKILSGIFDIEKSIYYGKKDIYNFSSYELSTVFGRVLFEDIMNNTFSTIDQELLYKLDKLGLDQKEKKKRYKEVVKLFDFSDILYSNIDELSRFNRIELSIAIRLLSKPEVLFLDDIFEGIDYNLSKEILIKLKSINNLTIILSSNDLELSTLSDKLIILNNGEVVLDGDTFLVLKEDSLLNKVGLEVPFMIDLSTKLKYYSLLDDIELDMNRMVDKLWK